MDTFLLAFLQTAAEHAESGGIPEWVPRTVNLVIFLTFLYFVLRKPLASFFAARTAAIRAGIDKAKLEKAAAEAKLKEVESRLAQLSSEQERIRAEARSEAEAESRRIASHTDEEVAKIAETAGREIDGALATAKAELQKFVAEKSVELAESMIRTEMNEADAKKMVDEYAEQLGGVKQ